jgi:hypothetical protein
VLVYEKHLPESRRQRREEPYCLEALHLAEGRYKVLSTPGYSCEWPSLVLTYCRHRLARGGLLKSLTSQLLTET